MHRYALTLILFALLVLFPSASRAEEALTKIEPLAVATDDDATMFTVEIADTDASRARGLTTSSSRPARSKDSTSCCARSRCATKRCSRRAWSRGISTA